MNLSDIADRLNYHVEYINKEQKQLQFYSGKFLNGAVELCKSIAPFGKVAVMGLKTSYEQKGKPFSEALKKNGNKPYSVLFPEKVNNIDVLKKMFALPEDVRVVVALDSKIFNAVFYFAWVRKIDVICPCQDLEFFDNFYYHSLVYNKNALDYVYTPANTHVILDGNLLTLDSAEIYAQTVCKLPAVFDYEIARRINGSKIDKNFEDENQILKKSDKKEMALNLFNVSLKSAFNVFSLSHAEQASSLILYALTMLVANTLSGGEFLDYSCPFVAERLLDEQDRSGHARLYGASSMLSAYEIVFSGKVTNLLEVPDYLERADKLKAIFKTDEKIFLQGLKTQVDILEEVSDEDIKGVAEAITIDQNKVFNLGDKMINTYHALGGKGSLNKKKVIQAVNLSGDLPKHIGGMTLVRESGLGEMMTRLFANE